MIIINRTEFGDKIAREFGVKKNEGKFILDFICETIASEIRDGNSVNITGFGNFVPVTRKTHLHRLPNGENIEVSAYKTMRFDAGGKLKTKLNPAD